MRTMRYMTTPLSIRFDAAVLERLRRHARSTLGATPSGLAQRLVDEGLRMADHPGISFKDGPSGRRAALTFGPDVWEVVKALQEIDERDEAAILATAEVLALPEARIRLALHYYSAYPDEIDAEIEEADRLSIEAEDAWRRERRLLA